MVRKREGWLDRIARNVEKEISTIVFILTLIFIIWVAFRYLSGAPSWELYLALTGYALRAWIFNPTFLASIAVFFILGWISKPLFERIVDALLKTRRR